MGIFALTQICTVCGNEVGNGNTIRGACGEWVCKTCLKKAKIGGLQYSCNRNITPQIISNIISGYPTRTEAFLYNSATFPKTIACRTCNGQISRRAKRCPHCGEITPANILTQTVLGILFAPFLVIIIFIAIVFYFGFFNLFL